jgi:hypothetical protein
MLLCSLFLTFNGKWLEGELQWIDRNEEPEADG